MRRVYRLSAIAIVSFFLLTACTASGIQYFLHCYQGWRHHEDKEYDKAIDAYTKAIAANDKWAMAYLYRGLAYTQKKLFDLAIDDYTKAIAIDNTDDWAYLARANAYSGKGQYDLAVADFTKAIEINPTSEHHYNGRGFNHILSGAYREAEQDLKKALEIDPQYALAIVSTAELYSMKKNATEACTWLQRGIKEGYDDWDYIKTSNTFDNIRKASCFKTIVAGR